MKNLELKVPPVAVVFIVASLMWAAKRLFPQLSFHFSFNYLIALSLVVIGFLVALTGVFTFSRAKTTTNPMDPNEASSLVSSGIYRFSRNPMYLGFAIALLGWGFYLSNIAAIVLTGLFILYMNRFQISPEERVLEKKFGTEFESYKKEVRRWL